MEASFLSFGLLEELQRCPKEYGQIVKQLLYFLIQLAEAGLIQVKDLIYRASVTDSRLLFLLTELSMNQPLELSLEQQFSIRSFETQVQQMSHEQAQDFLVKLYQQMVMREATYKQLLKHQWGLEPSPGV